MERQEGGKKQKRDQKTKHAARVQQKSWKVKKPPEVKLTIVRSEDDLFKMVC